jgi:Gram-negative bacterial TonB protein C-terminal
MRVLLPVFSFGLFCGTAQCHGQPEPVLRSSLTPTAPPVAAVPRVTGDARGSFLLDADGNVASVEIISRPALLRDATAKNNRRWKFVPATAKSAANSSYDTAFYYRIRSLTARENNRWITASRGSFHAIEITPDGPSVMTSSDAKAAPSTSAGATGRQ